MLNLLILLCSIREKGRYRYAGQWKHGRMHGCGLYEVNERTTYVSSYQTFILVFLQQQHTSVISQVRSREGGVYTDLTLTFVG